MGKTDDWFSEKGLANRAAGVKKIESKERKMCMCVFWAICFIVWIIFGALHVDRAVNALKIGADYNQFRSGVDIFSGGSSGSQYQFLTEEAYDSC